MDPFAYVPKRRLESLFGGLVVIFAFGLVLSGCGRTGVSRTTCATTGDCASGERCVDGLCVDPDKNDIGPDPGEQCEAIQGGCFRRLCDEASSSDAGADETCELEACSVTCAPYETQSGCSCEPASCERDFGCGEYPCVEGTCQPCEFDIECTQGQVCQADGTCAARETCNDPEQCPLDQTCRNNECVDKEECLVPDDCASDERCVNGRCTRTPDCETDDDCGSGRECVGGSCYADICSSDTECAGDRVCSAGECIKPSEEVARCFIATNGGQISNNQSIPLQAYALDDEEEGVSTRFIWSSSNPGVATISSNGGSLVGGSTSGQTTVTARVAQQDLECESEVVFTNPGILDSGEARFVVTDARTGEPISGATVSVAGGPSRQSNNAGVVTISTPSRPFTVSVFASDYNYLTVRGLRARDIRLPLLGSTGDGPVAGFKGEFNTDELHTSGDFTLGLAGASIPGGLLQVGVNELLGQPYASEIPQVSADTRLTTGLVAYGSFLGGVEVDIKRQYYASTPGGARIGWGLAGRVPPTELFQALQGASGAGEALGTLLPLFNRFDHAIRPLQLAEEPRVPDTDDIDGDDNTNELVPDYDSFPQVSLKPNVQQNLVTDVSVSNFPELSGSQTQVVVFVAGHVSRSAGFVPLGISATTDENEDGFPDARQLYLAPQHSSLNGGRYAVTALAFQTQGSGGGPGGPGPGIGLTTEYSSALWSRQSLASDVSLGTLPGGTTGSVDPPNRTISVTSDAGPLYRIRVIGDERSWEIFSTGSENSSGQYQQTVNVPTPPGGNTDLLTQQQTRVSVDAIETTVGIDDIAKATGVGLRRIGLVASSYNRSNL